MKKKPVFQKHHISYEPPVVVRIRKGVHMGITMLNRFKGLTSDEKRAVRVALDLQPDLTEDFVTGFFKEG